MDGQAGARRGVTNANGELGTRRSKKIHCTQALAVAIRPKGNETAGEMLA